MKSKITAGVCSVGVIIALVLANNNYQIATSKQGLEIIGNAEGCRAQPYYCPAQVLTVGIGTTNAVEKIQPNKIYTEAEIADLFAKGIRQAENCVNHYANGKRQPQGAFDALTSITFNVGCHKMKYSTLFKMARKGYSPEMCNEFSRWVYAGGKKLSGLVTRREKEKALCLTTYQ